MIYIFSRSFFRGEKGGTLTILLHSSMRAGRKHPTGFAVRFASLRSGGRRLAVRTAMEHPIGALPRTPFPASRDFPSRGNEKIGGTGYCVTYDTDSQSRNADFISIARRAIRNPRPERPSNLRTLRPSGRSILRTFSFTFLLQSKSKLYFFASLFFTSLLYT